MKISKNLVTLGVGFLCLYLIWLGMLAALVFFFGGMLVIPAICDFLTASGCVVATPAVVMGWIMTAPAVIVLVFLVFAMPLARGVDNAFGTHIHQIVLKAYKEVPVVGNYFASLLK